LIATGKGLSGRFQTEEVVAARSGHPLTGSVEEPHAAIDALDTDTVPESYRQKVIARRAGHSRGT
jgi:hypothetical protein